MPHPIQYEAAAIDLGSRFFVSTTVAASPAAAVETTICTLTVTGDIATSDGVYLFGWCAFTMGTSGTAATIKIRQTSTAGATVATSGATTGVAAALYNLSILGLDVLASVVSQVYVLTLTIAAGAAASTVSAAGLIAVAV